MPQRSRQLAFDLTGLRPGRDRRRVFASASNAQAVQLVSRWPDWPHPVMALVGPAGCGKSHLAAVWADRSGAEHATPATLDWDGEASPPLVLDDPETSPWPPAAESALFHRINNALAGEAQILLVGRTPPSLWPVRLPDLRTRLASVPVVWLEPPDDALLTAVLEDAFEARELRRGEGLLPYLAARMDRSLVAVADLAARLDHAALERHRGAVTRQLAAEVLGLAPDPLLEEDPSR